jgi:hypothetical protein
MTLYHLHGDDLNRAGDGRSALTRVVGRLHAAISAIYRSVTFTPCHLQSERTRQGDDDGPSRQHDLARYPQAPLILDDKWDF